MFSPRLLARPLRTAPASIAALSRRLSYACTSYGLFGAEALRSDLLPAPWVVYQHLPALTGEASLFHHLAESLLRLAYGFGPLRIVSAGRRSRHVFF